MTFQLSEALTALESTLTEAAIDKDAMRELELYIDNDGQLYRSQYMPILKNLSKKKKSGRYNAQLAVKAFLNLVDNGARKYVKEFGGGTVRSMFPKPLRTALAKEYVDAFEDMFDNKEFDFMESASQSEAAHSGDGFARGLKVLQEPAMMQLCKDCVSMHDQLKKMGIPAEAIVIEQDRRDDLIKLMGALTVMADGGPRYLRILGQKDRQLAMQGMVNNRFAAICRKVLSDMKQGKLG